MENKYFPSAYADWTGILAATICLLHCLAGPLILGVSAHAHDHVTEAGLPWYLHENWDYLFLVIGFIAVRFSARHSHHRWMKVLLWGSYASLAGSILLEHVGPIFQNLVYVSSIVLIGAHLYQLRNAFTVPKTEKKELESVNMH